MENMHTDVRVWRVMKAIVSVYLIKEKIIFQSHWDRTFITLFETFFLSNTLPMMVLIGVCEFSKLISKLCSMLHCFITLSSPTCCVGKMVIFVFVCNKLIYTLIFIGFY